MLQYLKLRVQQFLVVQEYDPLYPIIYLDKEKLKSQMQNR